LAPLFFHAHRFLSAGAARLLSCFPVAIARDRRHRGTGSGSPARRGLSTTPRRQSQSRTRRPGWVGAEDAKSTAKQASFRSTTPDMNWSTPSWATVDPEAMSAITPGFCQNLGERQNVNKTKLFRPFCSAFGF